MKQEILSLADSYCKATGLALATVSTKVMNDGKFFDRIAKGGTFNIGTYEKVKDWFGENMPKHKKGINKKLTSEGNGEFPPISQG